MVMKHLKSLPAFLFLWLVPQLPAAETVIKTETVSFEGCLKVIDMTSSQSGILPKISVETKDQRVAEFEAPDGTLRITCDRRAKTVTISTK